MQFWTLIVDSLRESVDRKIFWVITAITFLVIASMISIGFEEDRISLLFGMWEVDTGVMDPMTGEAGFDAKTALGRRNIASIAVGIADMAIGWVGLTLALIATAGFIPTFLERGAIDVVLSKPMSRPMLFLGKYVGSLAFVLLISVMFVVPSFLVIWLRWGVWMPGYLMLIPLLVLLFSYIYCVTAWAGVVTRSTIASALIGLGAWIAFVSVQQSANVVESVPGWRKTEWLYDSTRIARWCVPKTEDVTALASRWAGAGTSEELMGPPDAATLNELADSGFDYDSVYELEQKRAAVDAFATIGSSLAFEAVIVIWAMWIFSRKDY